MYIFRMVKSNHVISLVSYGSFIFGILIRCSYVGKSLKCVMLCFYVNKCRLDF